jgi:curved DNA-binding protein CbpA
LRPYDILLSTVAHVRALRGREAEALQGGPKRIAVRVDNVQEEILLTIPPGVRSGTKLRLRGKSRPGPNGTRGDLYLSVEIVD